MAAQIGDVQEAASVVADQVHLPAGEDVELAVVQPTEAAAVLADNQAVMAVGDDVDPGRGRARVADDKPLARRVKGAERVGERVVGHG